MPRDFFSLFSAILSRASVTGSSFQIRLLKIIVAAQRPLTLDEMREALSITPADATWRPQQQINNIAHALASCGSLVTVDEEERTIRFVHQSVSQFLLQSPDFEWPGFGFPKSDWHFTSHQASLELGHLLVTYLSYGVFDQQLSKTVIPNISVGQAPTMVVQHVLKDRSWKKAAAMKLLRLRSQHDPNLGRTITEVSGAYQKSFEAQEVFHLLAYAREYWLLHTRTISSESIAFSLWRDLLAHPTAGRELHMFSRRYHARTLWSETISQIAPRIHRLRHLHQFPLRTDVYDDKECGSIMCDYHPRVVWAITNSHLGLLSSELNGKHRLKALCGIVVYLLFMERTGIRPRLDSLMWERLWKVATALRMKRLATDIFHFCEESEEKRFGRLMELPTLHRQDLRGVELGMHEITYTRSW